MSVIIGFPFKSLSPNPHKHKYSKRPPTKVDGLSVGVSAQFRRFNFQVRAQANPQPNEVGAGWREGVAE